MNTKALRQKILDLAIHGKLVPQDPNDEPASVLLERIRAEKERLVKEGKIKRPKKTKATSDKPHYENVLPEGWTITTLGEIFQHNNGKQKSSSNKEGKLLKYITTSNVYWGEFDLSNVKEMIFTNNELEKCTAKKGDLLVCEGGDVGRSAIWNYEYPICIQNHLHRLRSWLPVCTEYFFYSLMYNKFKNLIKGKGIGLMSLSSNDLHNIPINLPPVNEQKRIVAEINRWFDLLKSIENNTDYLNILIKATKSKVLDLAIHGKLVPQDPTDEPASELLKRINPKAEITCDNGHYQKLPKAWCLTKVKDVFIINPKNKVNDDIETGFVPMTNISDGFSNNFTFETRKWATIKSGFTHFANGDIAVAKISPCLENRKSMVLSNLPNGVGAGTTELFVFRPLCVIQQYGLYFFKTYFFINQCIGTFNGVVGQQRVGKNIVEEISFPLPPIKEQHRIVAKIGEIFAQLDAIEASL